MSDLVQIEIDGRVAIVRFDTGARANALSQQLMQDLTEAALKFHDTPEISTVILTGRADPSQAKSTYLQPPLYVAVTFPISGFRMSGFL